MKILELIRYITQHPEYLKIVFIGDGYDDGDFTPMQAICELASIDASHYDTIRWRLEGSLEKDTLILYKNQ